MQINSHANLLASVSYIVYNGTKKLIDMLNIKPISDLRNYIEVLKQVDVSNRIYLTRNGHGEYGILTMAGMIFETRSSLQTEESSGTCGQRKLAFCRGSVISQPATV